jgi:deoxynucleoside triphosphate triphosphohydrolase SAMHD1
MAPPSSLFLPPSPAAASSYPHEEEGATGTNKRRSSSTTTPLVTQATAQKPSHRRNDDEEGGGRPFDEQSKDDESFLRTKKPRLLEQPLSIPSASLRQQPIVAAHPPPPRPLRRLLASTRRTNDEIHSTISLCPVTCLIMDTPEFQRLKGIKQLGSADFVYMNCNTTRFEHSVGVSELARRLITNLKAKQPQLGVTSKDVLCVKLAGLLHDVGHGPFSHVYEQFQDYLSDHLQSQQNSKELYRDTIHPRDVPYRGHESVSLLMVRHIFETSLGLTLNWEDLDAPLLLLLPNDRFRASASSSDYAAANGGGFAHMDDDDDDDDDDNLDCSASVNLDIGTDPPRSNGNSDEDALTTRDVLFIMECIWGRPIEEYETLLGPGFHGRPPHKEWMYDVVCNRHSGLDVGTFVIVQTDQQHSVLSFDRLENLTQWLRTWPCSALFRQD